jgi:hypothetical protein
MSDIYRYPTATTDYRVPCRPVRHPMKQIEQARKDMQKFITKKRGKR